MKKIVLLICAACIGLVQNCLAADYRYVAADELKGWLEAAKPVLLVDIQAEKEFAAHHIKGSMETNAYPVETEVERATLIPALERYKSDTPEAVVIVCPRGKGGAKRTYDYLKERGVPENKLSILTGGMEKWPHEAWVATK